MIHSVTATKQMKIAVPSYPPDIAGATVAYSDQTNAPSNASRYGSGFAAMFARAPLISNPPPPTARAIPIVTMMTPGSARQTAPFLRENAAVMSTSNEGHR